MILFNGLITQSHANAIFSFFLLMSQINLARDDKVIRIVLNDVIGDSLIVTLS